jgi:hypothetical protein
VVSRSPFNFRNKCPTDLIKQHKFNKIYASTYIHICIFMINFNLYKHISSFFASDFPTKFCMPISSTKRNSVALVRKRTTPTERSPLTGEVSVNFCGYRVSRGQCKGFLQRPVTNILSKLRGFSPKANYTDRPTAACRRS